MTSTPTHLLLFFHKNCAHYVTSGLLLKIDGGDSTEYAGGGAETSMLRTVALTVAILFSCCALWLYVLMGVLES